KQEAGASFVESIAFYEPSHQFGGRVLKRLVEGTRAAEHHDEVLVFEARPVDLLSFEEVYGEFHFERGFDRAALDLTVALPRVTVAKKEERARLEDGQHHGGSGAHSVVVHVAAEIVRVAGRNGGFIRRSRGDAAKHRTEGELDAGPLKVEGR